MNDDAVRVKQIDFCAAVPSLHLLRTIPLALSVQCFVPSLLINLLVAAVPSVFSPNSLSPSAGVMRDLLPGPLYALLQDADHLLSEGSASGGMTPVRVLLIVLTMSFTGIAITRAAGVQFCSNRRTGALRAMRHAARQWKPAVVSVSLILLLGFIGLRLFRVGTQACVVFSGIPSVAAVMQGALWIYAALLLLAMGITGPGWLLSTASIGVDSCDGAEALSRGINYMLSLFWRCLCFGAIILLLSWFSKWAIALLLRLATDVTVRSLSIQEDSPVASQFFAAMSDLIQESVRLSAFFSGISIAYVLLRQFEDNVGLRETDSGKRGPG